MKNPTPPLYSWMNPKLRVGSTNLYGKGNIPQFKDDQKIYKNISGAGKAVFANADIKKNEVLFVMGGYILSIDDENKLSGIVADKPIEVSENFSIGPRKPSDLPKMPQHYVNHSCSPNAGFEGQIFMVAIKPIKKNQEVAYDYAMVMHSNPKSNSCFSFDCACSTKLCRGVVTEDDWKQKDLQKRYEGYFQYYIQQKINRLKK